MAFNLTTLCMKDDPNVTPHDVHNLKTYLDKQRLIYHEGMQICRFTVISDYDESEFTDIDVFADDHANLSSARLLKTMYSDQEVPHPSFHQREIFKNALFANGDKTMFIDANVIPQGLMHSVLFSSLPEKGDPNHTTYELAEDQQQKIKDNNWATLNMALDWTETEQTMFLPYFYQHIYGDHADFVSKMFDKDIISKYETFAHFIEGEYEEFLLPMQPGVVGKYFVDDKERNDELNAMWEKNIRPSFPAQWRGLGGDEDAHYIHWEHDYRDLTKQTSLLYLDRGASGDLKDRMTSDYWLRLWIL